MSDRIPPANPKAPAVEALGNFVQSMFGPPEQSPFVYQNSKGELLGPLPLLAAVPEAGEAFMSIFSKIAAIPNFPPDAKEVAILAVGAKYQAAYELYSHKNFAQKKAGLSKDVVEAVAAGEKPQGLNAGCSAAFDAATHLAGVPGPLPKEIWDRCISAFGKDGTVALVHYIGAYAYTCTVLNAVDASVPE